jgi:surface carbohydrate biosynthesis protein
MKKTIKKIKKLLSIRYKFLLPKKTDLIIFDKTSAENFFNNLKNIRYTILDVRLETLNIPIIIYALIKYNLKFKFFFYLVEYIKFTKCKVVITFVDNMFIYYELKKYLKSTKFIAVQNGLRTQFFFEELKKRKNLEIDHFFALNTVYAKKYENYIKSNYHMSGSYIANEIPLVFKKSNHVNYISSGPDDTEGFVKIYGSKKICQSDYYEPEVFVLHILKKFCLNNNLELNILGRAKSFKGKKLEKLFYSKILGNYNYNFLSFNRENKKDSYIKCDNAELNVCIYSALGLETLSRLSKTFIFNLREAATDYPSLNIFWPMKVPSEGEFWTSTKNENEILKKLEKIKNIKNSNWKILLKDKYHILTSSDSNNKKFSSVLRSIINE